MKEFIHRKNVNLGKPDKTIQVTYHWRKDSIDSNNMIFLILPGLDESILDYQNFISTLKLKNPTHPILAIDLRGQGQTLLDEGKINSFTITVDHQLRIIQNIIEELNLDSIFVIGLSYGAGIALCLANQMPKKVKGLALLAPYVSKFKNFNRGFSGVWYTLAHLNPFYKVLSHFSLPYYFQIAKHRKRLNPNILWDQQRLNALTKLSTGIMNISTTYEAKRLGELPFGVHFLIGEKDDLVSVRAVEHLMNQMKFQNKTFKILSGSGHRLLVEDFEQCAQWVGSVLSKQK